MAFQILYGIASGPGQVLVETFDSTWVISEVDIGVKGWIGGGGGGGISGAGVGGKKELASAVANSVGVLTLLMVGRSAGGGTF